MTDGTDGAAQATVGRWRRGYTWPSRARASVAK
jgi:hypothetical protein